MVAVMRVRFWFGLVLASGLLLGDGVSARGAAVKSVEQAPVSVVKLPDGDYLLDYGRAAFGNLELRPAAGQGEITVRFGEALRDGRVDRTPPGSVRFYEVKVVPSGNLQVVAPPVDKRNTTPPAVLTRSDLGVLAPFRWVEISGWKGALPPGQVMRRAVFDATWVDGAASFHSSDAMLDRIWDLSLYTIKATTFAGVFLDGDRERLSYEADGYLNQLGYYAGDADPQMARDTFERLMKYPTWPSEWAPHMVFMAYADWMQTGDKAWLAAHYEFLKAKTLADRVQADGLVHSNAQQVSHDDIVDWPQGERDGYVFTPVNTVVNAFHLRAMEEMRVIALAVGKTDEAADFAQQEQKSQVAFQAALFNASTGLYRDGVGTDHSSLHANLFPLAFGLVPEARRTHVAEWVAGRGMRGSVYAAQYLMEGLFENGQAKAALAEMTAPGDRSWAHMVESGTTMTWEAWDQHYKPNQDWNHAWGAAPANLLPRFVLGVQVGAPGWTEVAIEPHPGGLTFADGKVPTPKGPVVVSWKAGGRFALNATLPDGMVAKVRLPATEGTSGAWSGGRRVAAHKDGDWWVVDEMLRARIALEVR